MALARSDADLEPNDLEPRAERPSVQHGIAREHFTLYDHGQASEVDAGVIDEDQLCVFVNGQELATIMCSPVDRQHLALGFLKLEGFIAGMDDIRALRWSQDGRCADIWLRHDIAAPARRVITSGCGGGLTFTDLAASRAPLTSTLRVTPDVIVDGMRGMQASGELYQLVRGVHTASLSDGARNVFVAQDIGRHNTLDRLCGMALEAGHDTAEHILFASGRISSEMLGKASRMGIPIVVSRTSPTSLSVRLARAWNITVIGYCRGARFRVYAAGERIRAVA
ncbi:MAG: formate dehydrogenase accessory sulfurtransferase FdhD [Thermoflexales bacterium]|nr:formate dehydrogenase accessory sulfurtransferase FdhD [Thermoflexales bacterium]